MKLLIVAATSFEIAPLIQHLQANYEQLTPQQFKKGGLEIHLLVTGVGQMLTAFWLGQKLQANHYDLLLNVGVAGCFRRDIALGTVVHVITERFGDLGAEDKDGAFLDIHDMGLIAANEFPFQDGKLLNPTTDFDFLPKVHGLTVNKVHGSQSSIDRVVQYYQADVESMEGAAFFYAALQVRQPFLQIRALSNYVEPRNRKAWQLELAIQNLNAVILEMLTAMPSATL